MKLERIEDFEVWKKATALSDAVSAILSRPPFDKELRTRGQIQAAVDSVLANMSEGFEQPTDRAFAKYLYVSKGSTAETCVRLARACKRGHLTATELDGVQTLGNQVRRMLTGLIKHLLQTPNRRRGLGRPSRPDQRPTTND